MGSQNRSTEQEKKANLNATVYSINSNTNAYTKLSIGLNLNR